MTQSSTPPKSLYLTGGSGYVGRNLIRHFVAQGTQVRALVRSAASSEIVRALGATTIMGDLLDADLADGMTGCDALIHAAADTDHGIATAQQARINVDATRNVFAAARAAGIARAVHLSTESVLLDGHPLANATEDHPLPSRPAGAYSRTKAEGERIALSLAGPDFAVMVIRPRMVWGRDDTTAMPQLLAAATSGQLAWINGGTYLTSTTHIANLCHGVALALQNGDSGEVYFITDGAPVAFRTMVSALLKTQGIEAPDKTVPRALVRTIAAVGEALSAISGGRIKPPLTLQAYATSAVEVTLDIAKARDKLGYAPVITMADGLAELAAQRPTT